VLFPFLVPGVTLDRFFSERPAEATSSLVFATGATDVPHTPYAVTTFRVLKLTPSAVQRTVDRSWSRRERWTAFQPLVQLARESDPDRGAFPTLLQAYTDQNWLQPYADAATRDPRLWSELGLAAEHVSFIGFIRIYTAAHPRTKAAIALLFLLDKMAQASQDALADLLDTHPAEQLHWTNATDPEAYRLVVALRRYYAAQLGPRGIRSGSDLATYYDQIRLSILGGILRSTPDHYRANDARFLIGAIYWRKGQAHEALGAWRDLTADTDGSYALFTAAIRAALSTAHARGAAPLDPELATDLDAIVKSEHGRWLSFSFDRLRQFGYRFDTF
jgi:hypothetical protein